MTYQSNFNIKDEPFSPSTPNVTLAVTGSGPASRAIPSAGSPAKRPKSESEAMQTSTLETKKKLQDAVLDRRKAKGFTDVPNILFEEPKDCKLTKEDLDRREKRKEQNRKAAKKCRAKKKELQDKAEQETAQYVESNEKMQKVVLSMYQRLCTVAIYLSQHLSCGDCTMSVDAQEEHRQFICNTEKLLLSCLPDEHRQHLARADIDRDDTSQLSDIIHNGYTSSGETLSPSQVNDLGVTEDLAANVSSLYEPGNLQSWDLENISPDIPQNVISSLDMDASLATAGSVANASLAEFTGDTQNHFIQVPDQYVSSLSDGLFSQEPATTAESTCMQDHLTDACHDKAGIRVHSSWVTYSSDSISANPEYTGNTLSHFSISPNLVQPNVLNVQSGKSLAIPALIHRGISSCNQNPANGHQTRQRQVHPDFNNNTQSHNPAVEIKENYSAHADLTGVSNMPPLYHPDISPCHTPMFFTFEPDHSSGQCTDTPGKEPISPFYAQGVNGRM